MLFSNQDSNFIKLKHQEASSNNKTGSPGNPGNSKYDSNKNLNDNYMKKSPLL